MPTMCIRLILHNLPSLVHFILTASEVSLPPQPQVHVSNLSAVTYLVFEDIKSNNTSPGEAAFELLEVWLCEAWVMDKGFTTGTKPCRGNKISGHILHIAISAVLCNSIKSIMLHLKIMVKSNVTILSTFLYSFLIMFLFPFIFYLSLPQLLPAPPPLPPYPCPTSCSFS